MANQQNQEADIGRLVQVRRDKLAELQAQGKDPFVIRKYDQTHHSSDVIDIYTKKEAEALAGRAEVNTDGMDEAQAKEAINNDYNERRAIMDAQHIEVSIAGRMMFKRVMGKASFCNIQDLKGKIQVYVARDAIGEEPDAEFKKSDIGDIYGVKGYAFRTKTGEVSIHAEELTLLSKSLQILPEKFHGMTNTDLRYRQRYVDLIMNEQSKDTFIKRSKIVSSIRRFLDSEGFMEVETPMLVSNAGGAAARPFETHFNALNEDLKLRISLELYLKRLIVGGLERVYEIGRVFRNEGLDTRHNPEFTLMELYQAYTDYNGMMDLTERMFRHVAQEVLGTTTICYNGIEMDLGKPFERITMVDAVKKYAGVDFDAVNSDEEAKALAKERGLEFEERHKKGDILNIFFEEYCEEKMIQPTFVMDHPIEISPLTKKNPNKPGYVERFEMFMNGWEMCNAYSELNDPIDQRERFRQQDLNAAAGDDEAEHTDEDFLNALEIGMPPTGGIGYGIDRMVMLFTDSAAIRDVLFFPTMKSLGKEKETSEPEKDEVKEAVEKAKDALGEAAKAGAAAAAAIGADIASRISEKLGQLGAIDFSKVKIEPLFEDEVDFETFSKSDFRVVKVKNCIAVPKSKKLLQFTLDDGSGTDRTILSGIHAYYEPEELIGKTCIAITNLPPRQMMGIDSCGMLISAVHEEEGEEKLHLLMVDPHIPAGAKLY
ncbi:MAG: lysine--tRNA ligase [Lachnospiraceae bacterium]|nr:lysine--tRNA ligase [Lachnospiraceae bacterium]